MDDLRDAGSAAREMLAYASQYVSAKLGGVAYSIKRLVLLLVLLAVVALIGITALVTATALLVVGLAMALAAPMPDGWGWLGYVLVGLVGAIGAPLIVWIGIKMIASSGAASARKAYEERLARQRASFGTDAEVRARQAQVTKEANDA